MDLARIETLSRKQCVKTPILALALLFAIGKSASGESPPNIILVMPDDVGYGDYSFQGNPIIKTPAIDAFVKSSVLFSDFHVSPTCAPTRSALLTGRHEFENGVTHTINERERLPLNAITMAQVLQQAGYKTGIFGKWHLGDEPAYLPSKRGFDEFYIHGAGGIGQSYPGSCGDFPGNNNINPTLLHNDSVVKTQGYCTDLFFAQSMRWIDKQQQDGKPFFAMITPNAAHTPHVLPRKEFEYLLPLTKKFQQSQELAKHYGMIENIDRNVGKLLEHLREKQLEKNTLVIYLASDNGGTMGTRVHSAGLRGTKGSPWQGGTRTWSAWRWPAGFKSPARCDASVAQIDIFPTIAQITKIRLTENSKAQIKGKSFLPLLQNPQSDWENRLLFTHVGRWPNGADPKLHQYQNCAVRDQRYSLVNDKELYDLKNDLAQKRNIIAEQPEIAARLKAGYDAWWKSLDKSFVNESAYLNAPKLNAFRELYEKK